MEIRVYDSDLELLGIIENHTSLLWNRKYNQPGSFELHIPATPYNIQLAQRGNLVTYRGAVEAGIIQDRKIHQSKGSYEIVLKGNFLEAYMGFRLIKSTYTIRNGYVETAMREILSQAEPIPLVELGEVQGFEDKITFQATYKNLLDYEERLSKYGNIGFRFKPDFTLKKIVFDLYRGIDRSLSQSDRGRVIFSDSYNNLQNAEYSDNDQLLKTVCYVGGQGEGSERVYVTVGDDTTTGLERREIFLSASDIMPDEMTEEEYLAALEQRGQDKLNESVISETFECVTESYGNFEYKRDYDLGDIITVKKDDWGIVKDLRITEITEIYEHEKMMIEPTLGETLPSSIDWSDT